MSGAQDAVNQQVEAALEACRDSLAALEQRYEELEDAGGSSQDLASLQGRVVAYSHLVAALREYVEQARRGNVMPEKLAGRVDEFAAAIKQHGLDPALHPTVDEAKALAARARGRV